MDHSLLLSERHHHGFRGIINKCFYYLFLQDGAQTIQIVSYVSNKVTHRVPQGSVLRPLLFLIYVNDIQSCSNLIFICLQTILICFIVRPVNMQESTKFKCLVCGK